MKANVDNLPRFLLLCGVFAPVMMMVIIVFLGHISPDYNPVSDSICQMGIPGRPYAVVLNGGYILYGILMGTAACGLYQSTGSGIIAKRLSILLCLHAAGTALLGIPLGVVKRTRDGH